jgi:hypothetical protein
MGQALGRLNSSFLEWVKGFGFQDISLLPFLLFRWLLMWHQFPAMALLLFS